MVVFENFDDEYDKRRIPFDHLIRIHMLQQLLVMLSMVLMICVEILDMVQYEVMNMLVCTHCVMMDFEELVIWDKIPKYKEGDEMSSICIGEFFA